MEASGAPTAIPASIASIASIASLASIGTFNGDVIGFGWDLAIGSITGAFLSTTLPVSLLESAGGGGTVAEHSRAYLALARMLRIEAHDYEATAETLARVLHIKRVDQQTRTAATHEHGSKFAIEAIEAMEAMSDVSD